MKGILDRIVDGKKAVILIEELNKQIIVDIEFLPVGSKEGNWFDLEIENEKVISMYLDVESQKEQEINVSQIMDSIRSKSKTSRFKRKNK